jgi:hypothetical protein
VDVALTTEQSDSTVWLNNLTPTGATPESPPEGSVITQWDSRIHGQWSGRLLCQSVVPNPSSDYNPLETYNTATTSVKEADVGKLGSTGAASSAAQPFSIILAANDCPSSHLLPTIAGVDLDNMLVGEPARAWPSLSPSGHSMRISNRVPLI